MGESVKRVNERNFVWNDVRISTLYSYFGALPYYAASHIHSQYEMFVFKDGIGKITVGDKSFEIEDNSVIIVPPHTDHSVRIEGDDICGMTVRFVYKHVGTSASSGGDKVFEILDACMPKRGEALVLTNPYFGAFCTAFHEERESSEVLASALICHLLEGLFLQVLRSSHPSLPTDTGIYSYTSRALSNELIVAVAIDDYMDMPGCTLLGLSERMKMSPRNIQRIIKSTYGKSFSERLAEIRISRAASMMNNPNLTLLEISQMAHYNRYDSFRKAFVSKMGMSPTEYRETHFGISDVDSKKG